MKTEIVKYTNFKGTHVLRHAPLHHHVGKKVATKEVARAKAILSIDEKRLKHSEAQLKKAVRERG